MLLKPMLIALLLAALPGIAHAQQASPIGRWRTVDDETGKAKSVVEVYQARDGSYAGKVVEILDTSDGPNPLCNKCAGANRNKPIKGMVILWGLRPAGSGWDGGMVLDPERGKSYRSKLQLREDGRKLGVSGCIAFICRSQEWLRDPA
ncbi:DUF2147 domain-containing protein [Lysobacter solisilvae (ex Woo and Kim 2020)]|uniref:DUF2147 domain-containing protein n=1 Tax=Agrilutibacter terrestris TaxID=2865112 RepID=A0A7H0FWD5_9GAMM|nr:DUF2147 domain-containing protein [Lysobacter terrestris]QNP40351.1 DUF2147 domain-containing protein [Lysobacter terrestris]